MNIEKHIEFDKIKEMWMNLAITDSAQQKIQEASFYLQERELKKQLRDTTDSRNQNRLCVPIRSTWLTTIARFITEESAFL